MASKANNNGNKATDKNFKYVYGELVEATEEGLQRDAWTRERHGVSQVERALRGEESPADLEADLGRLRQQGVLPDARRAGGLTGFGRLAAPAPTTTLRIEPGAVVGNPQIDVRARDKITGRAKYSSDMYLPGMLYVKALRSPHPHARVRRIDTSKAVQYPGVAAVITYDDVPKGATIVRPALT